MSGPPFTSVDRALSWAFQVVACDIGDISSIYRRRDTDPPHESEWTPFEKHGQASAILGVADRALGRDERLYLLARFGNVKAEVERMHMHMAAGLGTGVHRMRAVRKAWLIHCGERISARAVGKDLGVGGDIRAAREYLRNVSRGVNETYQRVLQRLEPSFLEKGYVRFASEETVRVA